MALTETQRTALDQPLDPKLGKFRKGDKGRDVSYLEGYQIVTQANTIFGYDAWGYSVDRIDTTMMPNGKGMIYWALVTVNVDGCGMRQDVGCHVIRNTVDQDGKEKDNVNNPDQHDLARKSCVTDALKRAFRTYGEQFGNSLYDKDSDIHDAIHAAVAQEQQQKRQVAAPRRNPPAQTAQQQRPPAPRPTAPPARTAATPACGATTPRPAPAADDPNMLREAILAQLADDPEAESKLPKPAEDMTHEEATKTLTWLHGRRTKLGALYGRLWRDMRDAQSAETLFTVKRAVGDARDNDGVTDEGYTALMQWHGDRQADVLKKKQPAAVR